MSARVWLVLCKVVGFCSLVDKDMIIQKENVVFKLIKDKENLVDGWSEISFWYLTFVIKEYRRNLSSTYL